MPTTASIRLNAVATPNETYKIGDTVSLSNNVDAGVSTWAWTLLSKPQGSAALIASPAASTTSFVVDREGGYLVRLVVNDNLPDEDQDTAVARILTQHAQLHGHAKDETGEGDPTEGWAKGWRSSYLKIDKRLGLADKRTVKYTGANTKGPKLLAVTGSAALPNGDTVPVVGLLSAGAASSGIYLWDGAALNTNDVVTVLAHGMSALVTNPDTLVAGDAVYLGTSGAITKTIPGTDRARLAGYCVLVTGSKVALWFEPAARFNNASGPAAIVIDVAGAPGTSPQAAHSDHSHPLTTFAGPTADIDSSAGAAGTAGSQPARGNHGHKVLTGLPVAVAPDSAPAMGAGPELAMKDHQHGLVSYAGPTADIDSSVGAAGTAGSQAARGNHGHKVLTGLPVAVSPDAVPAMGAGPELAMKNHQHGLVTYASNPAEVAASPSPGTSGAAPSRGDHAHAHGSHAGGSLHAPATPSTAGFMSAADKAKLDAGQARNTVMNGGLRFWQRGFQFPVAVVSDAAGYNFHGYMSDRWYGQTREDGGAGRRIDVNFSRFTVPGLPKTDHVCRIRNNNAGSSRQFYQFVQEIDRDVVRSIRGRKVSWSVQIRKGATSPANTDAFVEAFSNTGAASQRLASYSGGAGLGSTFIGGTTLTTSFQTFTGTSSVAVPAAADGVCIYVGSFQNGGGPADANDYIEFGEVSMVAADAPAGEFNWATGDLHEELQLLQRFYEKNYDIDIHPATAGVSSQGVNLIYQTNGPAGLYGGGIVYKVRKRVSPVVALYSPASGASNNAATKGGDTGVDVTGGGEWGMNVETTATPAAGLVAQVMFTADAEI